MSIALASGTGPERRLTEYQLQLARIRAEATGESVAHVLAVFQGVGSRRPGPVSADSVGSAVGSAGSADPAGSADSAGSAADSAEPDPELAPVIPLARADRSSRAAARRRGRSD